MKRSTQIKVIPKAGTLKLHWIIEAEHITAVFQVMLYRFEKAEYGRGKFTVLPSDVGLHCDTPQYPDQESLTSNCQFRNNKPCYYDGSSLAAVDLWAKFILTNDENVIWTRLERIVNNHTQQNENTTNKNIT
jgi:hypothetical protein